MHMKSGGKEYWKRYYPLYLMLIPGLLYVIIYKFLPLIGLTMAFKDFQIFAGDNILESLFLSPFVGIDNFKKLFSYGDFAHVFQNTIIISLMKLFALFPVPIILAVLISEIPSIRYKKTLQTVVYLPHFLSWVVVFGILSTLLGSYGAVNALLTDIGLQPIGFFSDPQVFRWTLVFSDGWKEMGWGSIIYLSAITGINGELYEAATIDGAQKMQQIWYITLPGIMPTVAMMLALRMGSILNAGFEQILVMYNPGVYSTADIIDTYVYRMGLGKMDYSMGTAAGLFNSVISFIMVIGGNYLSKKVTDYSIW